MSDQTDSQGVDDLTQEIPLFERVWGGRGADEERCEKAEEKLER